ncbi:hypothetical protein R1sor_025471 [Riccia sorocarpa]|uniref:Uncharacterized protein n=1 Tax=Riccia sorocarpa TaxID=122646 RepID=A0ABD3G8Q1_9MARC
MKDPNLTPYDSSSENKDFILIKPAEHKVLITSGFSHPNLPPRESSERLAREISAGARSCPSHHFITAASKHRAKTRSAQGVSTSRRPLFTFDDSNVPIISAPCGDVILAPPYVTRSLFRESLLSNNSLSVITNSTSAVVNAVHDICVIGVSTDVFSDEQLVGSNPCFDEFICCQLVDEFHDVILGLQKVIVRLFSSGETMEVFRSCCEFKEKFTKCPKHTTPIDDTVIGVQSSSASSESVPLLEDTILTSTFISDSESEWDECATELGDVPDQSDSGSDWEQYEAEICHEDLPRLGLLKLDEAYATSSFEYRMSDEFWASNQAVQDDSDDIPIPIRALSHAKFLLCIADELVMDSLVARLAIGDVCAWENALSSITEMSTTVLIPGDIVEDVEILGVKGLLEFLS